MASPDALIRLGGTPLVDEQSTLCKIYMEEQHHSSLEDFVQYHINLCATDHKFINHTKGVLMQVCM